MPAEPEKIVDRRHPEWKAHHLRWRWLLDSWEGGEAYRTAVYGWDTLGFPVRNLIRHKREYPDAREGGTTNPRGYGTDPAVDATDDDYKLRLARTPVPTLVAEVVETHLSKIFAREIKRESPDAKLTEWWTDIDGCGTTIDQWMINEVSPLLMVFGCLNIIADHPKAPVDAEIETLADQRIHKLDRCVASIILPENMVWWILDKQGTYAECLVCELRDDGRVFRHWTVADWTLYGEDGKKLESQPHDFGQVPIRRIFDRKRPRYKNVGMPRYEDVAECQREFYNRDSELILSDTTQAHPLLQGPEDYVQADGTIPIGPSWLLPKKKNNSGSSTSYEGFDVIDFPKGGAESIRLNLAMLRDRVDRSAMLTKPAGADGTSGNTVSQSGASKRIDQSGGNDLLSKIAATLQKAEIAIARLALDVLNGMSTSTEEADVEVEYPRSFDLLTASELAAAIGEFQGALSSAGECPETETSLLQRLYRLMMPGMDDDDYQSVDDEIEASIQQRSILRDQMKEATLANMTGTTDSGTASPAPDATGLDADFDAADADPVASA